MSFSKGKVFSNKRLTSLVLLILSLTVLTQVVFVVPLYASSLNSSDRMLEPKLEDSDDKDLGEAKDSDVNDETTVGNVDYNNESQEEPKSSIGDFSGEELFSENSSEKNAMPADELAGLVDNLETEDNEVNYFMKIFIFFLLLFMMLLGMTFGSFGKNKLPSKVDIDSSSDDEDLWKEELDELKSEKEPELGAVDTEDEKFNNPDLGEDVELGNYEFDESKLGKEPKLGAVDTEDEKFNNPDLGEDVELGNYEFDESKLGKEPELGAVDTENEKYNNTDLGKGPELGAVDTDDEKFNNPDLGNEAVLGGR